MLSDWDRHLPPSLGVEVRLILTLTLTLTPALALALALALTLTTDPDPNPNPNPNPNQVRRPAEQVLQEMLPGLWQGRSAQERQR